MKKLFLSTLLLALPLLASAYSCQVDGIYYYLIPKGSAAEVTWGDNQYTGDVVIPEKFTYKGVEYSVASIGENAFRSCSGLTSVTIPNSVTSIGGYAFYSCTGLTSVNIPNSVTSIGDNAFQGCRDLTSVTIPNSVTSIGESAFQSCTGLTSLTIGSSVTSIGNDAFYYCPGLTSIKVESGNTTYDSRNDCNAIIRTASNTLVVGCKNTVIPNSVTSIGNYAFEYCTGLTSVTIPNSVTSIGNDAFNSCTSLTSLTIGSSVTSIGDYAFNGCKNIETINSKISKLFEIKENVFASETYINAKLKIPVGTAYKYKNTAAWNKFLVIEESDDSGEQGGDAEMVDLCIQDSEKGVLTIGLEKGKSHTLTITPENGWKVYMIIFNNKNVTAQLNGNKFIIPALTGKSYLNISYEQTSDVNSAKTIPMLISAHEGKITVKSEAEGQTVNVYTMDGKVLGSGVIRNGKATIQTNQPSGESFIVKAGTRSVKMLM